MKTKLATGIAILVAACSVTAQDQKSAELQVLDHFVGSWDVKVTVKPAGGEAVTVDAVSHRRWSIGGKYILFDDPGTDGNELQMSMTYDSQTKTYPGVMIIGPAKGSVTGTWSAKTKTMSFEIEHLDGSSYRGFHRFVSEGYAEAGGKVTGADGSPIVEFAYKQYLRKPLGKAPTVEKLLASYHKAIGGLEAAKKLTTRRMEGTISLFGSPSPQPAKITVLQKVPDLTLSKVELPGFWTALDGHDGKVVWRNNSQEGTVILKDTDRAQKIRDYQFNKYVDLRSEFKAITSKGRKEMKGNTYDVLECVREDGSKEILSFHAWNHHLSIVKRPDITLEMSNYRKSGGVYCAATTTVKMAGGPAVMTSNFTKVEHGVNVDDAVFSPPKN